LNAAGTAIAPGFAAVAAVGVMAGTAVNSSAAATPRDKVRRFTIFLFS
jgi:hypothetical protein